MNDTQVAKGEAIEEASILLEDFHIIAVENLEDETRHSAHQEPSMTVGPTLRPDSSSSHTRPQSSKSGIENSTSPGARTISFTKSYHESGAQSTLLSDLDVANAMNEADSERDRALAYTIAY